jgi:hypothetical protein
MAKIKIGDKVVIKAKEDNDGYIGGVINYPTIPGMKLVFSTIIEKVSRFFGDELRGVIIEVGRRNTYLIESNNKIYMFTNDYNEMKLDDENSNNMCEICGVKNSYWVCEGCEKYICKDCAIICDTCGDFRCSECVKASIEHIHTYKTSESLTNDLIHNMEELAELIQALSKWARGKPNFKNIKEEVEHVEFVINNIKEHLEREGE